MFQVWEPLMDILYSQSYTTNQPPLIWLPCGWRMKKIPTEQESKLSITKLLFCAMNFMNGIKALTRLWSLFIIVFDWLERQFKGKVREHRLSCVWRVSHSTDATQWSHTGSLPPVGSGWDAWGDWVFDLVAFDGVGTEQSRLGKSRDISCDAMLFTGR